MDKNWRVGALIRVSVSGIAQMERAALAAQRMSTAIARQNAGLSVNAASLRNLTARLEETRAAALRTGVTLAGIGAGIAFGGITAAVGDAAKLQQILLSIKNETGATQRQIDGFYSTAFSIADKNGMTPVQAGEILRSISRLNAGQFSVAQMMAVAPSVAGFASNIHFNRADISVDEATKTGLQTAHLFRAYSTQALNPLLDSVYRLSGLMAEKPDSALRQFGYYVQLFKTLGISNDTSVALMALLDRAGFRNKIGTNVRAEALEALGPLQLTARAQFGKLAILEKMGIFNSAGKFAWNNKDGTVNYFGELAQIGKWASDQITKGVARGDIAQQMFGAFGKQGGTIASLFADPQMTGILAGIERYLKDPNVGLGAASRNRQLGLGYQFTRATSNLVAVMTELGYPWLQDLTNFFRGVGDNLHNFQAWLHQHRDAEKTIGAAFAGIATALGGFAVFGAAKLAGVGTLLKSITEGLGGLGFAIRVLAPWALRLVPIVGWIAGAVTAIQLINNLPNIAANIARWWQINQNNISYTIGYVFGTMGHWLAAAIQGLLGMAQAAIGAVMNQIRNPSEFAKLMLPGGQAIVASDIYQAVMKAQRDYQVTGGDPLGQFKRGFTGGLDGHSYQPAAALKGKYGADAGKGVNVHIETIQLKVDGDPKSAGKALSNFLAGVGSHPKLSLSTGGAFRTGSLLSSGDTVGGMVFGK